MASWGALCRLVALKSQQAALSTRLVLNFSRFLGSPGGPKSVLKKYQIGPRAAKSHLERSYYALFFSHHFLMYLKLYFFASGSPLGRPPGPKTCSRSSPARFSNIDLDGSRTQFYQFWPLAGAPGGSQERFEKVPNRAKSGPEPFRVQP